MKLLSNYGAALALVLAVHAMPLSVASAQGTSVPPVGINENPPAAASKITHIVRVYGQYLKYSLPTALQPAFESRDKPDTYLLEYVPSGETVDKWTQMVTITGAPNLASNRDVTPEKFIAPIFNGFNRACPTSFSAVNGGALKVDQHDAHIYVIACGQLKSKDETYSETALILAIKGEQDYYSVQWAERGPAVADSKALSQDKKWIERFAGLFPVMLCQTVRGEQLPYPSCLNRTK